MVDIAPKALRFARLAAEQQLAFRDDPELKVIEERESSFRQNRAADRVRQYVEISEATADFCVRVITAFLGSERLFHSSEWDGNDFAFLQAASASLQDELSRSRVGSH